MEIEKVNEDNFQKFVKLFSKMFPKVSNPDAEARGTIESGREEAFLALDSGTPVGFISLSVRKDYVNGTSSSPVAFIEAIYVEEAARGQGAGRSLTEYARAYARGKGFSELASDCLIDNAASIAFHKAVGFQEAERVVCFVAEVDE